MQRLQQLSQLVLQTMNEVGQAYGQYQRDQQLFCRSGCGECCLHPGIEASVLEMLPLAYHLLEDGRAEATLEALQQSDFDGCYFYQRHSADGKQGQCSVYPYRPAICRFFGVAGYNGREGEISLSVCKVIKADHPIRYGETLIALESSNPPMMRNGKEQIRQLDYELGGKNLPINDALQQALERVLFENYYAGLSAEQGPEL